MTKWLSLKVNMSLVSARGTKLPKKKALSSSIYIENRISNTNYNYLKHIFIFFIYILHETKFEKHDFQHK